MSEIKQIIIPNVPDKVDMVYTSGAIEDMAKHLAKDGYRKEVVIVEHPVTEDKDWTRWKEKPLSITDFAKVELGVDFSKTKSETVYQVKIDNDANDVNEYIKYVTLRIHDEVGRMMLHYIGCPGDSNCNCAEQSRGTDASRTLVGPPEYIPQEE